MLGANEQRSEVARLLSSIAAEYQATYNGLNSLAQGISQHQFITARIENMGKMHQELGGMVGEQVATAMIAKELDKL